MCTYIDIVAANTVSSNNKHLKYNTHLQRTQFASFIAAFAFISVGTHVGACDVIVVPAFVTSHANGNCFFGILHANKNEMFLHLLQVIIFYSIEKDKLTLMVI